MLTTRVKATGQLFDATTDLGADESMYRDASRPLQTDTKYAGHLFDAFPKTGADTVKFSKAEWHIFRGDELEDYPVTALRLVLETAEMNRKMAIAQRAHDGQSKRVTRCLTLAFVLGYHQCLPAAHRGSNCGCKTFSGMLQTSVNTFPKVSERSR